MRVLTCAFRCALSAGLLLALPLAGQDPFLEDEEGPAVVFDSAGGTVVAWVGTAEGGSGVFVRRGDAAGRLLGPAVRADSSGGSQPSLAPLTGGGFAVAWNAPDGDGAGLFLRRFDAQGRPLGAAARISAPLAGDQSGGIHPLPAGGFAAVWTTPARLALRRYTETGAPRGRLLFLRTFGTAETFHTVTPGPDGSLLVSWRIAKPAPCAWRGQRFDPEGGPLGAPFGICTFLGDYGAASYPSIAAGGGGYVVVWNLWSGIFGRRLALTGAPLGPVFRVDPPQEMCNDPEMYQDARVAVAPSGAFGVVWTRLTDPDLDLGNEIWGRLYTPEGTPGDLEYLSGRELPCLAGAGEPTVSAGPEERLALAWEYLCRSPGKSEVRVGTVALPGPVPPGAGRLSFARQGLFGGNEEDGAVRVQVVRTGGSAGALRVRYETAPGTALPEEDYLPVAGRLAWADGDASPRTIRIPLVVDEREEGEERFQLLLRPAGGGAALATATVFIDSPGVLGFSISARDGITEVLEGAQVPFTVERYGGRRGEVGIAYGWSACEGEGRRFGRLLWLDGDDSARSFTAVLPQDSSRDGVWESWRVFLDDPAGGARIGPYEIRVHDLAVQDDEVGPAPGVLRLEPMRWNEPVEVGEGAPFARVRVRRHDGLGGTVSVRWSVQPGTATPGADYLPVSGILTWGDSDGSLRTIRVPLLQDRTFEGNETLWFHLSDPHGGARLGDPAALQVTIRDNDPASPRFRRR